MGIPQIPPAGLLGIALLLAGCATYSPLPLPERDNLAVVPATVAPLSMNAVATLAVLNNPDLSTARARLHVAQAQAFAAGLLPDPQFSYTTDQPTDHLTSTSDPRYPEYNAYGLGLTVDLQTLLTHSSLHAAASASYEQARLDLLWQEWQTVAEARTLYAQQSIGADKETFLASAERIYAGAAANSQRALAAGEVTAGQADGDLALLNDVRDQLGTTRRGLVQARQGLRAVLGVQPDQTLPLQPLAFPAISDRTAIATAIERLARTRPDLRALQTGYRAQEDTLRAAVLRQFPDISIGITRARDVSNVHTTGVGVTLTLPLFDRGRGDIAMQRATRAQLRAEYQARLDQAAAQAWQLWDEAMQLNAQLRQLDQRLPQMKAAVDEARRAYGNAQLQAADYLALTSAYLTAAGTRFDLLQQDWTDSIALATVLGTQIQPTVDTPKD